MIRGRNAAACPWLRGWPEAFLLGAAVATGAALATAACAATPAPAPEPFESRLDAALEAGPLATARVSVLVVEAEQGRVLYARDPDGLRIPASNLKLFTALAVLDALGPTHRFETVIASDRALDAAGTRGVVGELAVIGGGDPALNSEDWWRLAADLRQLGLGRVDGDLVVDPSIFDSEYWHPDWGKVSSRAYHAPVAGLSANYGAFFVRVEPGAREGDPLRVEVDPPLDYLRVDNRGVTGAAGSAAPLSVGRGGASQAAETITVRGELAVGSDVRVFARSVRNPVLYAGALFEMQLAALGIEVKGRVREGKANHPEQLLRYSGRPLAEIVRLFLKFSNNAMAETLVKAMAVHGEAGQGNWSSGLEQVRTRLGKLGVLGPGAILADGSGLSPRSRVSARMVVDALSTAANSFRFGPEFVAALPVGGRDGTLEKRANAALDRVRAKTGLLGTRRVVALSGFAERADGERVVFSILVNDHAGSSEEAMKAVDAWLAALVRVDPAQGVRTDRR